MAVAKRIAVLGMALESNAFAPVSGEATSGINGAETMTQKATSPPCSV